MNHFSKKNYLVIGATSGIGKSVSSLLAAEGANIILMARSEKNLAHVKAGLSPGKHTIIPYDVADIENISSLIDEIKSEYHIINGMIFCVGCGHSSRLRDISLIDMQFTMQANCFSFIEFVRKLVSVKNKTQSLRIVAISSLASTEFKKYLTMYAASKAALEASIRCLATELGRKNIRINAIRPAFVDTPRLEQLDDITGSVEKRLKENGYQPLGLIPPDDVAAMVLYLLSDTASSINGVCISINGGASC